MILRSGKIVFLIEGLILLIGFPKNKYHPNTKNYLPCLVIGGAFSIRRKGLTYHIYSLGLHGAWNPMQTAKTGLGNRVSFLESIVLEVDL